MENAKYIKAVNTWICKQKNKYELLIYLKEESW